MNDLKTNSRQSFGVPATPSDGSSFKLVERTGAGMGEQKVKLRNPKQNKE